MALGFIVLPLSLSWRELGLCMPLAPCLTEEVTQP